MSSVKLTLTESQKPNKVIFMHCCWESTCELESNHSIFRLLSRGQKCNTSGASLRYLLKCLLDGPAVDEIAIESNGIYTPSMRILEVQSQWRKLFGARPKKTTGKISERPLPRRETGARRGCRKKGMAAFLERRHKESKACSALPMSDDVQVCRMESLQAKTEETAEIGRKRKEYESFSARIAEKTKKRQAIMERLADCSDPGTRASLNKAVKEAEEALTHGCESLKRLSLKALYADGALV